MDEEKLDKIENFVSDLDFLYKQLEGYIQFLRLDDNEKVTIENGLEILKEKIKRMKKSKSVDEIKHHLKVNKLMKKKEGRY